MEWLKKHKGKLFFLFGLVFFTYFNSLNNEFVSDDVFAIVNNKNLGDFGQVLAGRFYFLRPLEYFVVFGLFGKQAMFFRLINFVFHILAVWGVYALVVLLTSNYVGLVAAILFAVHPLGVESVVWISAGSYVQMTALSVWSLVFYLLVLRGRKKYYVWSVVCLVLALFTMERAVVVVGLMGFLSLFLGKLKESWKLLIIPAMLSLVWLGVSILGVGVRMESLHNNYYGVSTEVNYWIQPPIAIGEYLKLFVWPIGLTLYHSDLTFTLVPLVLHFLIVLGFLAGTAWAYFKNRKLFFWLAWFLICLSPTLLPFGLSWIVAERYVYMALIGLCVAVAMGFSFLKRKWGGDGVNFILVLLVVGLMFRTVLRNNDWQTADDLWFSAERYSTLSPQNHNNLGDAYGKRGMFELSRDHFLRAIELNPRYADAIHNLGAVYLQVGELEKARESYLRALEINPGLWQSKEALRVVEELEKKR